MTQEKSTPQDSVEMNKKVGKVFTYSIISVCSFFTIMGTVVGIFLATIALIKGDKIQNEYLALPESSLSDSMVMENYAKLKKGMILGIIGFMLCGLIMCGAIGYSIHESINSI